MESDKSISQGFKSKNNQQVERKLKTRTVINIIYL